MLGNFSHNNDINFCSCIPQNDMAFFSPFANSEYPRTFRVTGANQNARKLLSTDLVNTNDQY